MHQNRQSRRKGQAMVESALSLLLFLTIFLGIIDFGQYLYFQQALTERTRAAARVAVLDPTQIDRIKNVARYNSYTAGTSQSLVLPDLTAAMISVSTADLGSPEGRVTVTISDYPITLVTPIWAGQRKAQPVSITYPSEAPW